MSSTDARFIARFKFLEFKFIFSSDCFFRRCNPTAGKDVRSLLTRTRKIRPFLRRAILYFGTMAERAPRDAYLYARKRSDDGRPSSDEAGIVNWTRNRRPQ